MDITMHDGSHILLRKLEESYDPTNKIEALRLLTESTTRVRSSPASST
jgi:2-oxoglutarate ferredoxin oxidoreductase subunit beta